MVRKNLGVPGPLVGVRRVFGVPTFTIDGQPFMTPVFETYRPHYEDFAQFARAGSKVFSFNTNAARCDYGNSPQPTWPRPCEWNYSELDERVHRVLGADANALIMPRVYIGTPDWWLEQNPEELLVLDGGETFYTSGNTFPQNRPYPCIASKKWRMDMGYGLKHLIEHIQSSDYGEHIFGYIIAGLNTEEWYHWSSGIEQLSDYSRPMTEAFRQWLKEKYVTNDCLRKAWNDEHIAFSTAIIPSREERLDRRATFRDPAQAMNVVDYYIFYNEIVPDTIDYFAGVAREATGGTKVIGAFYGFMYEFAGNPEFGHNALGKYARSRNLDFVFATASYGQRQFSSGGDYPRSPSLSVMLHGKVWYNDNDTGSYLTWKRFASFPKQKRDLYASWSGLTDNAAQTVEMYRRTTGFALCGGMFQSFFDVQGGSYDDPQLMAEIETLNQVFARGKNYDRGSNSEILIVSDEDSCSYCSFDNLMLRVSLRHTQWSLCKIGAPVDHVLVNDLALLDVSRYKFVVFLNAYHLTAEQREMIDCLKREGRTLLWCYAPGYFQGTQASVEAMQKLTGLRIEVDTEGDFIAPQIDITRGCGPLAERLQWLGISTVGCNEPCCQLFSVEDQEAVTLGVQPGTSKVTLARKEMDGWVSMYSITPYLPALFYRELARQAGVHIYNDKDDSLYANNSYVVIHADGAGMRTIRFPVEVDIFDAITEEPIVARVREVNLELKDGETRLLRWEGRDKKGSCEGGCLGD